MPPKASKRAEALEAKRDQLAEALGKTPRLEGESYLALLLRDYAEGKTIDRYSLIECIVGKYRPFLRGKTGPNHDGPLSQDLEDLLDAAERRRRVGVGTT